MEKEKQNIEVRADIMKKEWTKENLGLWKSQEMKRAYSTKNYKEIYLNSLSDICIIFFSSNGIYYPNTEEEFVNTILQEDKYEWENHLKDEKIQKGVGKAILVRDIYKQWYVRGINSEYSSIEEVFGLLNCLTKGYRIITMGCSSGGYAAVLFGLRLRAERIFTFSGQFSIENEVDEYYWLTKYKSDKSRAQYYTLIDMLCRNGKIPVYYFYPAKCRQDIEQYNIVKGCNKLYEFAMDCSEHGKTIKNEDYTSVIIMPDLTILELWKKYRGELIKKEIFLGGKKIDE